MQRRKPTFKDILAGEEIVIDQTITTYGKWFIKFGQGVEVLMGLSYLDLKPPIAENVDFRSIVLHDYYQASFSFRACSLLMEHGFYSDAFICLRSLMERLVKNRYFFGNKDIVLVYEKYQLRDKMNKDEKDQLREELAQDEKKNKVKNLKIKDMFNFLAEEGAYGKMYKFLCPFVHKNVGYSSVQLNQDLNNSRSLLPEFNKKSAEGLINIMLYLLYGYLNLAPSFFEYEWKEGDEQLLTTYEESKAFFKAQIIKKRRDFPLFHDWDKYMRSIIEIDAESWGD